ncbi:MAG: hypothetical protein AAFX65_02195 [Cyanobacteria bacterium J06638_7]
MGALIAPLLALLLALGPASAAGPASGQQTYRCDGDPLLARADNGPVDAVGIPNEVAGTAPGAFVVLHWRDLVLQLPRSNDAGPPSYSDGKWWWSLEDPAHPRFQLRQGLGTITSFSCAAEPSPQPA